MCSRYLNIHRKIIHPIFKGFYKNPGGFLGISEPSTLADPKLDKEPWSWGCFFFFFGRIFWVPKMCFETIATYWFVELHPKHTTYKPCLSKLNHFPEVKRKKHLEPPPRLGRWHISYTYLCLFSSFTFQTHQSTSANFFPHHIKRIQTIWPDGGRLFFGGSSWKRPKWEIEFDPSKCPACATVYNSYYT